VSQQKTHIPKRRDGGHGLQLTGLRARDARLSSNQVHRRGGTNEVDGEKKNKGQRPLCRGLGEPHDMREGLWLLAEA